MTSILILQHQRPDGEVDNYHLKAGRRYHIGRGSQCQVRILDLKLSRQHCAIEHHPEGWVLVDLASTNGCTLDGNRVSGSIPLAVHGVICAGTTRLVVAAIHPADQPTPPLATAPVSELPPVEQLDSGPPRSSERLEAVASRPSPDSDELEPQSAPARSKISDPLIPGHQPPAAAADGDQDVLATMAPPAARGDAHPAQEGSRTYFISLLGRRVGPLTRNQARDLKARELKGTLTAADLAEFESTAEAAAEVPPPAPPAAVGDEQRTYYITLLGQRVGPLSRAQARELKARELKGQLSQADIAHLIA